MINCRFHKNNYVHLSNDIEWKMKQMSQREFEGANKPGKLLARQLKRKEKRKT